MSNFTRWNFEVVGDSLMVCHDNHDKGQPCEYEQLDAHGLLGLIELAQSVVLKCEYQQTEIDELKEHVNRLGEELEEYINKIKAGDL